MLTPIILIWLQDGGPSLSDMVAVGEGDFSKALAQALQDKVLFIECFVALFLMSHNMVLISLLK